MYHVAIFIDQKLGLNHDFPLDPGFHIQYSGNYPIGFDFTWKNYLTMDEVEMAIRGVLDEWPNQYPYPTGFVVQHDSNHKLSRFIQITEISARRSFELNMV